MTENPRRLRNHAEPVLDLCGIRVNSSHRYVSRLTLHSERTRHRRKAQPVACGGSAKKIVRPWPRRGKIPFIIMRPAASRKLPADATGEGEMQS